MSTGSASSDRSWVPREGDTIAGRYRVKRLIGAGGMGAVVAAEHIGLRELVAIKFMHPKMASDQDQIARFVREAQITARIKDDHVVRVFDVGATESGLPFLAMELLHGEDLGHVSARGALPVPFAVDCILQAIVGLSHAHVAGVVHRDIKPSNLWLTTRADGTPLVKVLDFGISKLLEGGDQNTKLTETSSTFGSPSYMSPEQVRSAKRVDHRADIWALGVVLFELLTQRLPFEADNASGVLAAVVADEPLVLSALRPDVPPALSEIARSLLRKNPAERPPLIEVARALRPFASPAGQATADLITRTFGGTVPSQSISAPSLPMRPVESATAFSETQSNVTTTSRLHRGRTRLAATIAGVIGAALVVGVIAGVASSRRHVGVISATSNGNPSAVAAPASPPSLPTDVAAPSPSLVAPSVPSAAPSVDVLHTIPFKPRAPAGPLGRPGAATNVSAERPSATAVQNAPPPPPVASATGDVSNTRQ